MPDNRFSQFAAPQPANRFAQFAVPSAGNYTPPTYPYEGPTAAAGLTGKTISNTKDAATLPYDIQTARNQATTSGIKAKSDQIDLNIKTGVIPGNPNLKGEAYLASLPAGMADMVRAYDEGRMGVSLNMRSPQMMQIAGAINHYDPSFDATKYNTRLAAIKSGAVGKLGSSDNALNTAIVHAGVLHDQAIGTPQQPGPAGHDFGSFPLSGPLSLTANALDNWSHKGSAGQVVYNDTAGKLAGEEAQAYGMGTQGERDNLVQHFDQNLPLNSKLASIKNAADLFASKIAANLHQFQWGNMGNSKPSLDLLNPDARATLERIAPEVLDKYFSRAPDPMAAALGVSSFKSGNPPGGGNQPPPTGGTPLGGITASTNGYSDKGDPQAAASWENAARQGLSYGDALKAVSADNKARGVQTVTPIPPDGYNKWAKWFADPNNNGKEAHPFSGIERTPLTGTAAVMNDVAKSGTGAFLGNYGNAAAFGLPKLAAGQDQSALFNSVASQNNPAQAFTGDLVGTLSGLSLAGRGVGAAARGLEGSSIPALQRFGNIAGGSAPRTALTGDAIYGGISGAAQNPDHPVLGAIANAGAMVAGHGAGKYILGPGVAAAGDTKLGQFAVNKARSLGGLVTGGTPAPFMPPPAPELNLGGATQQALPDITSRLQQAHAAGLPYMVADADPRLRAMLGSATRFSPDVRAQAENTLVPRQLGQGERAIDQINTNLAPVGDVPTLQANILKSAQTKSAPLYTAAKAQPVPDLAANPKLKEVLDRPAGQSAIRSGYETALNKGEDVGTLTYATDPQGNPVTYGNPSWNVIHYARQALDKSGDTDVRQALDKQIAGLNPGFKAADAAYSGAMKGSDALQAGSDSTAIKVTPETTLASLNNAGPNTPLFQQGYASNLADMIGRQRMAGNPYDLVNGSMFQKQKMGAVFPQGADAFNTAHSLENDMGKTYQSVIGGSPTQPRAMDDKLFTMGDMADGGMDLGAAALTGTNPIAGLISLGVRKGIDAAKFGMGKTKADAIAPFLMNQDPAASLATLSTWAQQNAARKAYLDQVRAGTGQLGAGFSAPAIYGASQN